MLQSLTNLLCLIWLWIGPDCALWLSWITPILRQNFAPPLDFFLGLPIKIQILFYFMFSCCLHSSATSMLHMFSGLFSRILLNIIMFLLLVSQLSCIQFYLASVLLTSLTHKMDSQTILCSMYVIVLPTIRTLCSGNTTLCIPYIMINSTPNWLIFPWCLNVFF